jgi:NAD(P)H-dependent FMN reductase
MVNLIFLSGSIRKDSLNKKLAKCSFGFAKNIDGVNASFVDLKDFEMPIYNGDLEAESGLPENAKKLKEVFKKCDGFFIASPEYNSSFSALLKNSLDWISRPHEQGEGALVAFSGKVAAISAASPGGFGGLRGLVPLRMMLENISTLVIPKQLVISAAHNEFDASGNLVNDRYKSQLNDLVLEFADTAKRMKK